MQTFLPYSDFEKSAKVLDYRRLGKQRVECLQLLNGSWPHHPASKMWRGHFYALADYGIVICDEWISRGYKDTCKGKILCLQQSLENTGLPNWFGNLEFHRSHKSNLLRKNQEFYSKFDWQVPADLPYIWPNP